MQQLCTYAVKKIATGESEFGENENEDIFKVPGQI